MPQSILSNTVIASSGRVLGVLLGVVTTAALTRLLGVESFGTYTLLFSYGALFQIGADFGLYLTLTRLIAQQPDKERYYINRITSLRLVLLLTFFLLGTLLTVVLPSLRPLTLVFLIIAVGFSFQSLSQLLMGIYQKYGVVWRATVGDIVGRLVQLGGIIITALFIARTSHSAETPLFLVITMFTAGATAAYLIHHLLLPVAPPGRLVFAWPDFKRLMRLSWPLGAMLILNAVYFRIDVVILSLFRSADEVGLYGLAYRIIESALFFPAMFGGLLLPRLSRALVKKNHHTYARQLIAESLRFLTLSATFVVIAGFTLALPIVTLISGASFRSAAPLLQILSVALFVMFFGNLFGFTLVALKRQKSLLILYTALALFNLITNLMFIPIYGATAAAWTTVVTETLAMASAAVLVYRAIPFHIDIWFTARVIILAAATITLVLALPPHLPVLLVLLAAIVFYTIGSLAIGLLHRRSFTLLISKA